MIITLCSSITFFDRLKKIKEELEKEGYSVLLPEIERKEIKKDLIKRHFEKINSSDAIYVANYSKRNIKGYIGGNCFLEMGKAYDKNIPIFIYDNLPKESPYLEELISLNPIVIGRNWNKIKENLENKIIT